jgi:hypothetical protein
MPFDETEELPDLVRLRLSTNFLQVHQLGNPRMGEDVVTPGPLSQAPSP